MRLPTVCLTLCFLLVGGLSSGNAQLHHFAVEAQGGGAIAGQTCRTPFFIQILAQDSLNGTVTGFTGTVDISSNGSLLAGLGTSAGFTSGLLASHSVTFSLGGSFTLTATRSAGAETGVSNTFTVNNPLPQINSLSPSNRTAGDTGFTLTVTGSNFTPVSSVLFNGSMLATAFASDSTLTAFVPAPDIDSAGLFPVTVSSPAPGGGTSNQSAFTVIDPVLRARIFLEGPYAGGGTMSTQLRTDGVLPASHPFSGPPWNYAGTESVAVVPPGVVDWVLLSLRTGTAGATRVSRRAALLMSNGSILDLDGSSPVTFSGVGLGSYFVVVRHRNHLPAMTASARPLNAPVDSCDFTIGSGAYFGGAAKSFGGGLWGIYSGDYSGDEFIDASDFAGPDNEIFLSGYRRADLNLDGFIDASDFVFPDNNIFLGSSVPN